MIDMVNEQRITQRKNSLDNFLEEVTFVKIVVGLAVSVVIIVLSFTIKLNKIENHMNNNSVHLTDVQSRILYRVEDQGFPFTNAHQNEIIQLRKDVDKILLLWSTAAEQGRLQSPGEKEAMVKELIKEALRKR